MALTAHIQSLQLKHQELETQLDSLKSSPSTSDLELNAVKRTKLQLKDEITRLMEQQAA